MSRTIFYKSQSFSAKKRSKRSGASLYIPFETTYVKNGRPCHVKERDDLKKYGVITHTKPLKSYYMLEIDADKKDKTPHIHIWNSNESKLRLSDTRSRGVDIFSGLNGEEFARYSVSETRDKRKLKSDEEIELCRFLNEDNHRFAIFCLIEAHKSGKKLPYVSLNIDDLIMILSEQEIQSNYIKFNRLKEMQKPASSMGE